MGGKVTGTLWAVAILLSAGIVLAYTGNAAPVVTQSRLPGGPPMGFGAIAGLLGTTWVVTKYLSARAWRQLGGSASLQPAGTWNPLAKPDFEGEVNGYSVTLYTYVEQRGQDKNSKRYTVVEATLRDPVEWRAIVSPDPEEVGVESTAGVGLEEASGVEELDELDVATADGECAVLGELPREQGSELLTPEVQRAVGAVDAPVSVGETEQMMVDAMLESIPEESETMGQSLTAGMLSMAQDGDDGPTTTVVHRDGGLLRDGAELQRRIEAVTAIANAVDRVGSGRR